MLINSFLLINGGYQCPQGDKKMFKDKIAISKNFLIAICFLSLILFAVNNVNAMELNDTFTDVGVSHEASGSINAIDEDKLGNSQQDALLQSNTISVNGGDFSVIQNLIHYNLTDGDTLILNGEFTASNPNSYIILYKNITFTSTSKATLNGKDISTIFVIEKGGSGSSFSNLIFKNGREYNGGAVLIYGKDVTFEDCTFRDNYASHGGGAVYTHYEVEKNPDDGRNLLIKNCDFINNRAAIAAGALGAYGYNNRIINCRFDSNSVYNKNGGGVYGGAIQVGKEGMYANSLIKNCIFTNNKAISISGTKLSHGGASCLRENVTYENCIFKGNSADFGGALTAHCSGTIKNCTFIENTANDYGGAVSNVDSEISVNLKIIDCDFTSNSAPYGGAAKLAGYSVTIDDCNFNKNYASIDGGAVYIDTNTLDIFNSDFNYNSAKHNGGAVFVNGKSTNVQGSNFRYNTAIANPKVKDDGLGGAIYINGTLDTVNNNKFEYNVARNGSAIYYDKTGKDLKITNNVMTKNQAWVYALPIYAKDIYYGEREKVGAVIYGGNNIADYDNLAVSNAIYNAASNRNIKVNGETPVLGATNSGQLYQDSREYNIDVLLTVKHQDGTVVYNRTLKSSYLGEVSAELTNLKEGTYTVTATHFEDNFYKAITNKTTFVVKSKVDVSVSKDTAFSEYNYRDSVVWTINVVNNGPSDATGVKVNDVLPAGLVYQSYTATVGSYSNGVWNIGNLAKGKSATLRITTLVNKTGDIINNADVVAKEFDWNTSNNHDSEKISVKKAADLAITKTSNVTNPNYGNLVKWTLTVTNNGPDIAHDVVVSDVIPNGLIFKSSSGNYANGKWSIGTLNVGQSKSLDIITLVNVTGNIKNTATVSGYEHDYNLANNQASKTISVPKATDLAVTKVANNTTPNYASLVKWTVTVRNNGPDAATGVKVSDVLPSGLVYQSYTASVGTYSNGVWTVGNLAKGASQTLNIISKIAKTGSIKNVASVTGNEYDINKANNRAEASVNVANAVDLAIVKTSNVSNPNYGDLVKWTLTVTNNGPDVATEVFVGEVIPAGLVFKSADGFYANGKWSVGTLNVGQSKSLNIITLVNVTGNIKNIVTVSGKEYDYNPSNNKAEKTISVPKAADLAVTKVANITAPNYAGLVKWTVTVKNNGPDAATGVKVSDVLPEGMVYQSYTASVGTYSNGVWTVGNLAKGASQTLNIISKIAKTGSIKNVASVTGNEYDINKANNRAEASVNVPKSADLEVIKNVNKTNPNYGDLVKWMITVKNNGPDVANDVVLTDVLPSGLIIVNASGNYVNGKWSLGSLNVGGSKSFEIVTLVNKTGSLVNKVSVVGREYDYNLSNNNASKTILVPNAADLSVIKTVNDTAPNYLKLVKWTVTVRNNGPDAATGVKVSDILPEGMVYQSYTASVGTYSNGVWTVGNLAKGASQTLSIICKVTKTGYIKNVASVTGNEYDIDKSNNRDEESVKVPKACDLEIIKSVSNSTPNYHDTVKWMITVKNNGPDNATGVFVEDILPEGLVIKSASAEFIDGKWKIGNLSAFSSKTLVITTFVNKTGLLINNANVTGREYDHNKSNNKDNSSIDVPPSADLEISKIVDNRYPQYNDNVKWIIIVKNNGPDKATGVKVNEILSDAFKLVKSTASKGYYINGVWDIGDLNIGERVNLEIISKVVKTGNFTNVVNVTGNEYDYNPNNNDDNESIEVYPSADLEVVKKVNNTSPNYNSLVKWTVTVKNNGPDKANEVEITDILPKGLEFVSYRATKGHYNDGFWKFCCLEVGEYQNLEIVTRVKAIGEIKNIVSATAKEYDHNPDNNKDESQINVAPASDLEVTKSSNQSVVNYKQLVKWNLIVKNNGPSDATRVVVIDLLPEGLTFISAQGDGNYSTTGTWYIGNLASGEAKSLTIITRCDKTGEFTNVAVVRGDQHDYNPDNDKTESTITVPPAADLAITKSVSKAQFTVGDVITYRIELVNNGPNVARNINVSEIMDDFLEFESAFSASGDYDSVNHVWHVNSLANGEKTYLDIKAIAVKEGIARNKVSVVSDTFDYNLENNLAECIVEIIREIIDPKNPFNPGLNSRFNEDMVAKASIGMKETGLPIALLMVMALISLSFCGFNISKKR